MQFTKYGVTLHNSYLSMLFTDFKAAFKPLSVEMPNLTSPLRPLSLSSADITASRVPRSVSCDMLKKFLWRDLKTGQLSFFSFSSVAQYICRTIEDQQLSIILAAFFLHFHHHVLKREMHDFEVLLRWNTLGTFSKLLKTRTALEKMLALPTRIF